MTIGKKIQELRKTKGMSQELLSEHLNVSRQAISKWENDQTIPSSENLVKLADLFNVPVNHLLHPNMKVELVMEVRKELAIMKKQSKSIFVIVGIFLALFIGTFATTLYGTFLGGFNETKILYFVIASAIFMLLAFLPILVAILRFVFRDCKQRGIKPTFWVIISISIMGLMIYLLLRDSLTKPGTSI